MENIKYIKRIDTGNKTNDYIDGQTIDFVLPRNKIDLSSFKIYYDAKVDPAVLYNNASYLKRFLPRLSASIIQTLTVSKDGVVIQEIKDYNVIFNIINDCMREDDNIDGNRPDTLNYAFIDDENIPRRVCDFISTPDGPASMPLKYSFFISSFLGLINESSSNILDCSKHTYKISILLAPRSITYRGINNQSELVAFPVREYKDYHYYISNVFANVEIYPESTPVQPSIAFKHYEVVKDVNQDTKNTNLSYKHKGKLDYLIASFVVMGNYDTGLQLHKCNENEGIFEEKFKNTYLNLDAYTASPVSTTSVSSKAVKNLSTENNLDNSLYFKRAGSNIKSSQFFINGQAITPSMDIAQIYGHAKEFFNNQMTRVKTISSFEHEFFVFPLMISQMEDDYSTEIVWECTEGRRTGYNNQSVSSSKVYPILILCNHKKIDI